VLAAGTRFTVKYSVGYKPWTRTMYMIRELIYCLDKINVEDLFYQKKLCFEFKNDVVSSFKDSFVLSHCL